MNKLINIKNENGKKAVSAKELYLGLGLAKAEWSRWYPSNIESNDFFLENEGWVSIRGNDENLKGGRPTTDFAISIEFAKHIAMMARTEKSHEYRNYFLECEKVAKEEKPTCIEDVLIQSLQEMKDMRIQIQEAKAESAAVKQEVQDIRDVIVLDTTSWRKDTVSIINKIAFNIGGFEHIKSVRDEIYKSLEQRMGVSLSTRLTNKRRRMADEGVCKSKRDKLTNVDIIGEDKKLIEGYVAIVKEMGVKNNVVISK